MGSGQYPPGAYQGTAAEGPQGIVEPTDGTPGVISCLYQHPVVVAFDAGYALALYSHAALG